MKSLARSRRKSRLMVLLLIAIAALFIMSPFAQNIFAASGHSNEPGPGKASGAQSGAQNSLPGSRDFARNSATESSVAVLNDGSEKQ